MCVTTFCLVLSGEWLESETCKGKTEVKKRRESSSGQGRDKR